MEKIKISRQIGKEGDVMFYTFWGAIRMFYKLLKIYKRFRIDITIK